MTIYVDYKGPIDPKTGEAHVGQRILSAQRPSTFKLILYPGVQGIDDDAWAKVRGCQALGWDEEAKDYGGPLIEEGHLRILPSRRAKGEDIIDWSKLSLGELREITKRTGQPAILLSLQAYVQSKAADGRSLSSSWARLLEEIETQLREVLTDFDGKQLDPATAQANFRQVIEG